jgi:hypothetical protein
MPADEAWIMRRARAVSDHEQEPCALSWQSFSPSKTVAIAMLDCAENGLPQMKRTNAGKMQAQRVARLSHCRQRERRLAKLKQCPSNQNQNQNQIPIEDTSVSSSAKNRGTRLPRDFVAPQEWIDWAIGLGGNCQYWRNETEKFRDYWSAKSGKDATKLEWKATWRNWCRNAIERNPPKICERPFKASDLQLDLSQLNPDGSLKHDTKPH